MILFAAIILVVPLYGIWDQLSEIRKLLVKLVNQKPKEDA